MPVLCQQPVAGCGERLHLADGNCVEPFEPVVLRQGHVDELGVHALDIGQHQQLLDAGVFAHVAFKLGIGRRAIAWRSGRRGRR